MFSNMLKKFGGAAMSPIHGAQKLMSGDWRGGLGDMAFGPDAYYGNYWKKKTGLRTPQADVGMEMDAELGPMDQQVGYGDYSGGMGASGVSNPYAMLRGR